MACRSNDGCIGVARRRCEVRNAKGLGQAEIGKRVGLAHTYICRVENGAQPRTTVQHALVENLCGRLHGSFVRPKVELASSGGSRLLSLCFLVPRDSVEAFRFAARDFLADKSLEARFKGPWLPYDFVDALQTQAGAEGGSLENRPV